MSSWALLHFPSSMACETIRSALPEELLLIRCSPSQVYLLFLLTEPANLSNEQVIARATELGLPWISSAVPRPPSS